MTVGEEQKAGAAGTVPTGSVTARRLSRAASPTGARYVLLIATLALAGAYAGQLIHNLVLGRSWAAGALQCMTEGRRLFPGSPLAQGQYAARCTAPLQRRVALIALAGSAAVLVLGLAGLRILPRRLKRAAGPLKTVPPSWQEQARRISWEMGITHPPRMMWGAARVRDAFTLGRGRGSLVVLPRGIRFLREAEAEAVIRHELAHIAKGDATIVWLTRGVWWALLPVLLTAPFLTAGQALLGEDTTPWSVISQPVWAEYGLRSLVLIGIAALIAQMIMRSREHEADVTAAHGRSLAPWESLLGGSASGQRPLLDAAFARHPTARRRLAVLRDPSLLTRPTLLDTVAVGLLTAVLVDAVNELAGLVLTGTTFSPAPVSAVAAGLLLTFGWGTAAWRGTGERREGPGAPWWLLPALGASTAAGVLIRLQSSGLSDNGVTQGWPLVIVLPSAVVGAAALSSAFARMRSRPVTGERTTLHDRLTELVVALLFSGALWLALDLSLLLKTFPNLLLETALITGPYSPSGAFKAVALAVIAVCAVRAAAYGAHGGHRRGCYRLPATTAVSAVLAATVTRLLSQAPVSASASADIWRLDVLTALCAGTVCAIVLIVLRGSGGLGDALYAAPVAATLTTTALWATRFGSLVHPLDAWATVLVESTLSGLALVLLALAVPAGFLPSWETNRSTANIAVPTLTVLTTALTVWGLHRTGDTLLLHMT